MAYRRIIFFCLILLALLAQYGYCREFQQVAVAMHISSQVSDGTVDLDKIVSAARANNIRAVILTDKAFMQWSYGLWPLRNVLAGSLQQRSIFTYGPQRYLDLIAASRKENPDILIIPGAETAPFYYWSGNPLKNTLAMHDWHKHLVVAGLERAQDYRDLPVAGNPDLRVLSIPRLLWFVLSVIALFISFVLLRRRKRILGISLLIIALITAGNNLVPFDSRLDPFSGDQGIKPYQELIDYTVSRGGIVYWAHPQAKNYSEFNGVRLKTDAYIWDLARTKGYTGFEAFYDGLEHIAGIEGIWDNLLLEYCRGVRKAPVWAAAGLQFDFSGDLDAYMRDLRMVCLCEEFDAAALLEALRQGRCHIVQGEKSPDCVLQDFSLRSSPATEERVQGEELATAGDVFIRIKLEPGKLQGYPVTATLVRDGVLFKMLQLDSPLEITIGDTLTDKTRKHYYRLVIEGRGLRILTNPVFVSLR